MTVLKAVEVVLAEAGEPLHYTDITQRILARGLWETDGKTPEATVNSQLNRDIQYNKNSSPFQRTDRGTYALRVWRLPDFDVETEQAGHDTVGEKKQAGLQSKSWTFTDAAEYILDQYANKKPMHYREITKRARERDLIRTKGRTPEETLRVEVSKEVERQELRGETPRFVKLEKGLFGLSRWIPQDIPLEIEKMGGVMLKESDLLDYVKRYIAAKGYYFDDETIKNYHICLKTRPFVILAGLSGTGKSKLSQLYAQALGHTVQNKRYLRLAVRPNWNDDRYLLGYLNSITGEYVTEPAVDFIMKAEADRDNLYFFCLDEMNLAHVEYYFSQFLSALEEDNPSDRWIPLMSERVQAGLSTHISYRILVPPNLLFTGTINVDETTQPLSDKVIDRANTIEFFAVELDKIPESKPLPDQIVVSAATWSSYITHEQDTTYRTQISEIGKILNKADLGLGYRVLRDIELYLANSKNLLQSAAALDLQVKQRILPRVRGTETIRPVLDELTTFIKRNNLIRSEQRLEEMKVRLKRDGYTNFWR